MSNNKYLVQSDWLTELPTMEKPEDDHDTVSFVYLRDEYKKHLASLPKICRCEGLKDGAIVEAGKDFEWWDNDGEMTAIPLHREQGEDRISQIAEAAQDVIDSHHPSTPAGKEEAKHPFLISLSKSIKHFKDTGRGAVAAGILLAYNRFKDGKFSHPSPQSEQAGEKGWQQVISDRINYFATHHHKFESKELHDALNVILRLVPPALWQAASQEKGVRWQLCPKCNGDGNLLRYNSPNVYSETPICDICEGKKVLDQWLSAPAPDTVQGQEELWEEVKTVLLKHTYTQYFDEDSVRVIKPEAITELKSKFTLTKNS